MVLELAAVTQANNDGVHDAAGDTEKTGLNDGNVQMVIAAALITIAGIAPLYPRVSAVASLLSPYAVCGAAGGKHYGDTAQYRGRGILCYVIMTN